MLLQVAWFVALTQLSSCSVERVFYMRDACGDNSELRLLLQCNGDLDELLELVNTTINEPN